MPLETFHAVGQIELSEVDETSDNKVVWHDNIASTYTATFGEAFVGVKRLRLATAGTARQNIELGLAILATANFQ